jgi:DNA invertase Pin-like site-specific DNA recombinase
LAEFERDILRQRVNAGLKAARRRGTNLKKARALLRSGDYTKVQVAEELESAAIRSGASLVAEGRQMIRLMA